MVISILRILLKSAAIVSLVLLIITPLANSVSPFMILVAVHHGPMLCLSRGHDSARGTGLDFAPHWPGNSTVNLFRSGKYQPDTVLPLEPISPQTMYRSWQAPMQIASIHHRSCTIGVQLNGSVKWCLPFPQADLSLPQAPIWSAISLWSIVPESDRAWEAIFAILPVCWFLAYTQPFVRLIKTRSPQADGKCKQCGYDLRATPDRCPECGTTPAQGIQN